MQPGDAQCLLVNTTGELRTFYEVATVVFVGKSLFVVEKALQNPVEAAALGKPVIVGPNIESFEVIVRKFLAAGAMVQVHDAEGLTQEVRRLLNDAKLREQVGSKAKQIVEQNRGSVEKTVELLGRWM
jgi:3-deoxy-D-manno-octulosonic-acid transferase